MPKDSHDNDALSQAPRRKKQALGKGLDALIPEGLGAAMGEGNVIECDPDLIQANRFQPRLRFAPEEMAELSRSIAAQGIIQPLVVRREGHGYELVAGERRLRAARMAGLKTVPVVVRDIAVDDLLEVSLVENIQRENLNPLEEADAFHQLITQLHLTQEEAANRVGKSRPAVANSLRLRQLPEPIKADIREGVLSMGHARALLGADTGAQQVAAWRTVVAKKLSVRETESLIRRLKSASPHVRSRTADTTAVHLRQVADDLARRLGTRVRILRKGKKGRLEVDFYSDDDLDRLLTLLQKL